LVVLSLTRKTEYALVAMTDLARKSPANLSAREIGRRFRLPLPVLTNILNQLARRGLVTSTRGPKGGYRLAREPNQISLANVIEAIEGSLKLTACCCDGSGDHEPTCEFHGTCPVNKPIQAVDAQVREILSGVTLEEMAWNKVRSHANLTEGSTRVMPAALTDGNGQPAVEAREGSEPSTTSTG
jgi:Rrf2 family protein